MLLPTRTIEQQCLSEGFGFVVGIDEAGRGPLVGSVVAGAVIRKNQEEEIPAEEVGLIRDSKKLSEAQREKAFQIVSRYFWVGVGECDSQTIDRMNILEATLLSMRKAVSHLRSQMRKREWRMENGEVKMENGENQEDQEQVLRATSSKLQETGILLIDGNKKIHSSMAQRVVVGGDGVEQLIAAASIVAKVTRDREMRVLHTQFGQYGFDKHKGYGTKMHMDALKKFGPTPFHRMSFRPVRESVTMERVNRDLSL